ncbi:MAG: S41 family peptidase [Sphingomonadales bacterium]|jgi:hypothetical protein
MTPWLVDRRSLLAATLALPATAMAQTPASPALTPASLLMPDAMQADLALLGQAYATLHPGLDRYLGHAAWARLIAGAQRWAAQPRTAGDFYLQLSRLTAAVKCGHSYPNPNNHRRAVREGVLGGRNRVPFSFRWLGGEMVVTGGLAPGVDLPAGSIITRLDGMAPPALLRAMLPLARADGSNDAKRVAQLQVTGQDRLLAFDVLRPLLDRQAGDIVQLAWETPDGRRRTGRLPAMTEAERAAGRGGDDAFAGWRFAIVDGVGRLTMPNWATYDSAADWRAFLQQSVDALIASKARGLIVDIRGNEGGEDCGDVLLARLIGAPLAMPRYRNRIRYRATPAALRPLLDTWDPQFQDWGDQAHGPDAQGWYDLVRPQDTGPQQIAPQGPRFAGPVLVLVDAECSSATFQFALAVQQGGVGRIIGSPTGGNRRGINGGCFFFLSLPATGFEADLPVIGGFPDSPQPDAGVLPDVAVPLTAADVAMGRDPALAAALRLLA